MFPAQKRLHPPPSQEGKSMNERHTERKLFYNRISEKKITFLFNEITYLGGKGNTAHPFHPK